MVSKSDLAWIKKSVKRNLAEQEQEFYDKYSAASDEELLDYLRSCARELGGTPYINDVYCYKYIKERLGRKWDYVLAKAGIPKTPPQDRPMKGGLEYREIKKLEWCVERTRRALARQEAEFAQKHAASSNAQLLQYIKQCADELGYTPNSLDIVGGQYIARVFGGWNRALALAGLPKLSRYKSPEETLLFAAELKRQQEIYEENMRRLVAGELKDWSVVTSDSVAKNNQRQDKLRQEAEELAQRALPFKERLFAMENATASNGLLLGYLAACAEELGRLPYQNEVIGGEYIGERFGGWKNACWALEGRLEAGLAPEEQERLIFTREVQIQKYLLNGQETAITFLYKNGLIETMQAGNIYHILRWNPQAKNSARQMAHKMAKAYLVEEMHSCWQQINKDKELLAAEMLRQERIYNKTLEALDLQTRRFVAEHRQSTRAELLDYLQGCVREMTTSPCMLDIIGGMYICRQLGENWTTVLKEVGLKPNGVGRPVYKGWVFRREFKRQTKRLEQQEK